MKRAQVPVGFELSLFASEPDIVRPIAMTWDERGRLWVVETLDYPNGLHTGNTGHDLLKICEDTDGDGKADKFTVFATGLSIATSVVHANGGVIVSDGPRMLFLKDTNGDDVADERRVLFEGFKMHDTHAGTSNLHYGFDGWIYATDGYAGFDGLVAGKPVKFDTGVFRFRPDGSALEFLGKTSNNTWGLGFTSTFDVLGSTANRQPAWQLIGDSVGNVRRSDRGTKIYPTTLDVQGSDGWDPPLEILGDGKIRAKSRNYTAAAGYGIYSSDRFPSEWRDRTAFVCEPTGHLVSLGHMHTDNADFTADFDGNNLYASTDAWSAPVVAETGPDGAVWIADWYNIIVQHLRPGAPFEQTKVIRGPGSGYLTPLREHLMGRIYRLYPKGSIAPAAAVMNSADPATLVSALHHPSLVTRLQAQRLLVERGQPDVREALIATAKEPGPASLHALWALKGLNLLDAVDPAAWLQDPLPLHRRGILQVWSWNRIPDLDITKEPDPFVIREWLLAVSHLPPDEALGRRLRDWHRNAQQLRKGEVLDRCFAAAAARHSTGFLLASLENAPDPSVLTERIYPAAIAAFTADHSPSVLAAAQASDSILAKKLLEAASAKAVVKKFTPDAVRLTHGESVYAATCAACHQLNGTGVDAAFPPLDGSARATGDASIPIRIVLQGLSGPVEPKGRPAVNSLMPPLANLTDQEIADVLTFVRHQWSNDAANVTAAEVSAVRTATKERQAPWTAVELK
jgi:putative membrane-bound dehydrogenase-like protein